jgi:hypothetical protein
MYPLLLFAVASFPFVDLEVIRVADRSIVLPYITTFLLAAPLVARPFRLTPVFRDPTIALLTAWLGIVIVSTALGISRYVDEPSLRYDRGPFVSHNVTQVVNLGLMVVQYALFVCALRAISFPQLQRVVGLFIAVGVVASAYSLYQIGTVFYGWPFGDVFRTSTLYRRAFTLDIEGYDGWIRFPRAYGVAPEPSMWGAYLVIVLGFVMGRLTRRVTSCDLLTAAFVGGGILVTFSRSAWLSAAIVLALWALLMIARRIPRVALWAMLPAIIVWTVLPAIMFSEQSAPVLHDLSTLDRISAQMTGFNMFVDHPVLGVGFGSFPFVMNRYLVQISGYDRVRFITVFSFFLLVLLSTGVVGATVFVTYLASVLRRLDTAFRLRAFGSTVGVRAGSALAAVAALAFWLNTPAYNVTYVWFCFAVAAVLPAHLAAADAAADAST